METPVSVRPCLLEQFDEQAWIDMYAAAPAAFSESFGLGMQAWQNCTSFFCNKIPFVHFNCTLTLGQHGAVTENGIREWELLYRQHGCAKAFAVLSPSAHLAGLRALLGDAGFKEGLGWDRVYRNNAPPPSLIPNTRRLATKEVTADNAKVWADFVCDIYGLPCQPWLLALAGRPGWHHFLLYDDGKPVAARSCYLYERYAWVGIDAPVPGIMSQDYEADYVLMHALVQKVFRYGAKHIMADIEQPDDDRSAPPYHYFRALGFSVEYRRAVFVKDL